MNIESRLEKVHLLRLSEKEAQWLQDTMRNPFNVDKSDMDDRMRKTLFDILERRA